MQLSQVNKNKNAIHKRLDELTETWVQFTEKEKPRLYRFLIDNENEDLIEAFISYHQEENSGLADLFLRFENPFDNPKIYGSTLIKSLVDLYQDTDFQELMMKGGVSHNWELPSANRQNNDYANFAFCCKSFYEYHKNDLENLVLILTPSSIHSKGEWVEWLSRLLNMTYPSRIRFIVLDNADDPMLDGLENEMKDKVFTDRPEVDMLEIMEKLAEEGNPLDSGVQFRQCFVGITRAAEEKNEEMIKEKAKKALQIVDAKEWYPLKTTLYITLAGAYYSLENQEEALSFYKKARRAAGLSEQRGDVEGKQLVIYTAMAEASALIGLDNYADAAEIYDENARLIEEQLIAKDESTNLLVLLENHRMASYCYFVKKEKELAWDRGVKALETGRKINEEKRLETTLSYAGQQLLEITKKRPFKEQRDWLHDQMIELLGEETWADFLEDMKSKSN